MDCRFSFKQVKRSEVLIEFAQPKIMAKIEKYSTKPIDAHVTFAKQGFIFEVRCTLKGGDGFNSQVEASGPDLHNTFDLMLDKLEIQLRKQKEKIKRHKYPEEKAIRHLKLVASDDLPSEDWDSIPIDAADVVKYEKARHSTG
jgi:ribosomal subunit interface protein